MFESYPGVKGAFGTLRSMSSQDKLYADEIRAHGRRVLGTLELVISHSNDPEHVINHLHELGHKHITFNAKVEFMDVSWSDKCGRGTDGDGIRAQPLTKEN